MAIAQLGTNATASSEEQASLTVSHTMAAGGTRVVVWACFGTGTPTAGTIDSATYDGNSMTAVTGQGSGPSIRWFYYVLGNSPATGAKNVVGTFSASSNFVAGFVIALEGVDQTTSVDAGPNGGTTTGTVTTVTDGAWVLGGSFDDAEGGLTAHSGDTQLAMIDVNGETMYVGHEITATAGAATVGVTAAADVTSAVGVRPYVAVASTYTADIAALGADHHWKFDGNSTDAIGSANGTDTSILHTGAAIAKDATNSAEMNGRDDRISIPTTTTINNSAQARKAVAGWFMVDDVELPHVRIYGEGNQTTNFQFILFAGNSVALEVRDGVNFQLQIYSSISLAANRAYQLCGIFEGNGYGNEARFYIDGIEQTAADPTSRQPADADLGTRGVAEFGDPAGTVGLNGVALLMNSPGDNVAANQVISGFYQHWCAWGDEADAVLTDTEVRQTLFESGALAEDTVVTAAVGAMQTAIDLDGQVAVDAPCVIEVEEVTGGGDFTLNMNGQNFDPLASIHIRYNGIADTLTIVDDGTTGIDAAKLAAPFGGTIELRTAVTVSVTALDASDSSTISGARILLEADTGGPLAVGTDVLTGLTNGSGLAEDTNFLYESDQPVVGILRKGTAVPYYKEAAITGTITENGLDLTTLMVGDS